MTTNDHNNTLAGIYLVVGSVLFLILISFPWTIGPDLSRPNQMPLKNHHHWSIASRLGSYALDDDSNVEAKADRQKAGYVLGHVAHANFLACWHLFLVVYP